MKIWETECDPQTLDRIHQISMAILNRVGLDFHADWAAEVFRTHGFAVDGRRVFFRDEKKLIDLISQAPRNFTLRARNQEHSLTIGGTEVHYGPGLGAAQVVEADGRQRSGELRDVIDFQRLFHQSPLIGLMGSSPVAASDLAARALGPLQFQLLLKMTDKAVIAPGGAAANNSLVLDLAAAAFGGRDHFRSQVHFLCVINTLSPLAVSGHSLEALRDYLAAGQGVILTPCAMAGGTGPMTLAGTLAQSNAEVLGAAALAQLLRPEAPVVYGFQSGLMDPASASLAVGAPEQALFLMWGAALARYYGLPSRDGGLLTDAVRPGIQSGYEAMMTALASRKSGLNLILQSVGIVGGLAAMSLEQAVADLEILAMVERLAAGFTAESEDLALEVVERVGPGGGFLTDRHTLKNCRRVFQPRLSRRGPPGGQPGDEPARLARLIRRNLDSYQAPDLSPRLNRDLDKILKRAGLNPPQWP